MGYNESRNNSRDLDSRLSRIANKGFKHLPLDLLFLNVIEITKLSHIINRPRDRVFRLLWARARSVFDD